MVTLGLQDSDWLVAGARLTPLCCLQVQLKEYVKVNDTIYEVDPKEENCFRFSRLLNFKVSPASMSIYLLF